MPKCMGRSPKVRKIIDSTVVVRPSSRLHKELKGIMGDIYAQLLRIRAGEPLSDELEHAIGLLSKEFAELKPREAVADIDHKSEAIWNMNRR